MSESEVQPSPEGAPFRVLIADDVQETRRSTRLMMSQISTVKVVAIAHDGRQAVEMTQKHGPDIAVMDVNMPRMNGLVAIQKMLEERPEMACIVISAERDAETLREAITVGASDYLTKPFTAEQLRDTIQRVSTEVMEKRKEAEQAAKLKQQRDAYLKGLAKEYAKARRTDDKAIEVFEELAAEPNCELQWLVTLAIIYMIRMKWGKLKVLAERLERRTQSTDSVTAT